jgi:hypothetical protein
LPELREYLRFFFVFRAIHASSKRTTISGEASKFYQETEGALRARRLSGEPRKNSGKIAITVRWLAKLPQSSDRIDQLEQLLPARFT